jgi:hypothetical protein
LTFLYEHDELYTPKVAEIFESYREAARDLYDSHEEAEESSLSEEGLRLHFAGELGFNELTRAMGKMYHELEDIVGILVKAAKLCLEEKGLLNATTEDYINQLGEFLLCAKKNIDNTDVEIVQSFNYDFKTIREANFEVSPEVAHKFEEAMPFKFFHTPEQKERIQKAIELHERHAKHPKDMLYEGAIPDILKSWYREVEKVEVEVV